MVSRCQVDHSFPQAMRVRRQAVEHPFRTIKPRMVATHFLMKRLKYVTTEMALAVLADNHLEPRLTRAVSWCNASDFEGFVEWGGQSARFLREVAPRGDSIKSRVDLGGLREYFIDRDKNNRQ
jgi:hypothetical protein